MLKVDKSKLYLLLKKISQFFIKIKLILLRIYYKKKGKCYKEKDYLLIDKRIV